LRNTINSVKSQSYNHWECILVDDGSSQEELANLNQLLLNDSRFKIITRTNDRLKGANACRNIGIEKASGKYIALLDSDDIWPTDYLEKYLRFAESKINFDGAYAKCLIRNGEKEWISDSRDLFESESYFDFLLDDKAIAQTSTFFLNTIKAKDIKFDESLLRHQDWDFFIRFGEKYKWNYYPDLYAIVIWEKGAKRTIDFYSCMKVYSKYKSQVSNIDNLNKYLFSMYEKSLQYNADKQVKDFYLNELLHRNYKSRTKREVLMMRFPFIYKLIRMVVNKIGK